MKKNTKALKPLSVTLMTGFLLLCVACSEPQPPTQQDIENDAPLASDTPDTITKEDQSTPTDVTDIPDIPDTGETTIPDATPWGLPLAPEHLTALREQGDLVWLPLHEYHGGTDYMIDWNAYWTATPPVIPALAVDDGTLVHKGAFYGLGDTLILRATRDGKNTYFLYGHLDAIPEEIEEDALVYKGQNLGTVGTSGYAGPCPHIHLQIVEEAFWDKTLGEVGLEGCGLANPLGIEPANALVQASCFHYYSEDNVLKSVMDTVYRPPSTLLPYPPAWAEQTAFYPYVECANVCAAYCFDLEATPQGCAFPVGNDECPQCTKINEDPRCDVCPGTGCAFSE